ncbi:MAG: hypothetical protein QM610_11545 [Chitinophagaceae bacterium]
MQTESVFKNHPSTQLQAGWIDIIRSDAATAECQKRLTSKQLQLCLDEKWFLAIAPKEYGGLEWDLPRLVAFEEAIGWADGSTGWVFTLCSGAGWFGGFLEVDFAKKIYASDNACLAGSGAATGTADLLDDGTYLVNGTWAYASGAPDATIFTTNCRIYQDGQPVLENNAPLIQPLCFFRNEVTILETWTEIGLVASAGHSFRVDNVRVPKERTFKIDASFRNVNRPLYQFPFIQLAAATIAANFSGMCIHFMELFQQHIQTKKGRDGILLQDREAVHIAYSECVNELESARENLSDAVQTAWNLLTGTGSVRPETEKIFPLAQTLAQTCRNIVNRLFPYCGLTVMRPETELSRVWRDFQTGSQHALFCPA